jgi:hypothetical protein
VTAKPHCAQRNPAPPADVPPAADADEHPGEEAAETAPAVSVGATEEALGPDTTPHAQDPAVDEGGETEEDAASHVAEQTASDPAMAEGALAEAAEPAPDDIAETPLQDDGNTTPEAEADHTDEMGAVPEEDDASMPADLDWDMTSAPEQAASEGPAALPEMTIPANDLTSPEAATVEAETVADVVETDAAAHGDPRTW